MAAETRKTTNLMSSAMPHVTYYCLHFVPCDLLLLLLGYPPNIKEVFFSVKSNENLM